MISTHEMRFEFERVLRAVKAGRSQTLTYRSKPLARIVPLREEQTIAEDDPIFRLDELAEPIGAPDERRDRRARVWPMRSSLIPAAFSF